MEGSVPKVEPSHETWPSPPPLARGRMQQPRGWRMGGRVTALRDTLYKSIEWADGSSERETRGEGCCAVDERAVDEAHRLQLRLAHVIRSELSCTHQGTARNQHLTALPLPEHALLLYEVCKHRKAQLAPHDRGVALANAGRI
eukprot:CAMPEP_0115839368 /NCGR_PEP_ID=MMETSP0287-20121206/6217_1 /TAXON_ID=412157 /ORGANISM="Chrysochromulina rotalis, Strain UIO044" /LENGTH=142 /DNA_ID=CAMNT_0003292941 /DNA_START=277 /DNA_END=706 /DNA_ORIENTATION=+